MATIEKQKFKKGDLVRKMHLGDVFESCTFSGTAKDCNFAGAKFEKTCRFKPGFKFEHCNLMLAQGIEDVPKVNCTYINEEEWRHQLGIAWAQGAPEFIPAMEDGMEEGEVGPSKPVRPRRRGRDTRTEREMPDRD